MLEFIDQSIQAIAHIPPVWGLFILFFGALLEYVFPPFPGDTIVLFGSFLVGTGTYSFGPTFASVTGGSLCGAILVYMIGLLLHSRYDTYKTGSRVGLSKQAIQQIDQSFRRWSDWLILANRFLPGIRAAFFFTAGLIQRPPFRVIGLGAVSLLLWNSFIMVAGYQIGSNWTQLRSLLATYSRLAGLLVAVFVAVWLVRLLIRIYTGRSMLTP